MKAQSRKEQSAFSKGENAVFLQLYEVKMLSSIAQSVEHAAVNRAVVGSSPTRGVGKNLLRKKGRLSKLFLKKRD